MRSNISLLPIVNTKTLIVFFDPLVGGKDTELATFIENAIVDDNVLLICEVSSPDMQLPEGYFTYTIEHRLDHLYELFVDRSVIGEHLDAGALIVTPGYTDWLCSAENVVNGSSHHNISEIASRYPYILVIDTGLYLDIDERCSKLSTHFGLPVKVQNCGTDHYSLVIDNSILKMNVMREKEQLKKSKKRAASYAISIDFVASMADITTEQEAITAICSLFTTIFGSNDVVFRTLCKNEKERLIICPSTDEAQIQAFIESEDVYFICPHDGGFAVKVSTWGETFGVIDIHGLPFPENIDEYLSMAIDLAKTSGLVISSIRRYHELLRTKEEQMKLTEMLRVMNRILRHDISNDLHIIMGSMDMFEESGDPKFIEMMRKAAKKCVNLINDMRELDPNISNIEPLELLSIRKIVDEVIAGHRVDFSVTGDGLVMADRAFTSVLNNIVNNANIHGKAKRISIDIIRNDDDSCTVSIADDGIGIPDAIKPKIFDEGFKYGSTGNTGIGLYIAKKTIERYGGCLSVEDNVPVGTKFIIKFKSSSPIKT